ncbi:MAG: hypothetical protein AMS20_11850 [Gemmatimonas sp. SG8_28]|nr:MAG: hypothetical protein AMS20_11850 [Gemmatimonas sp. SG8_28]
MHTRFVIAALVTAALVVVAACSSKDPDRPTAADATWSTWPGSYTAIGTVAERPVTFVIRLQQNRSEGSISYTPPGGSERRVPMKNVNWDGTVLEYSWTPSGTDQLDCRLYRKSDVLLTGDCMDRTSGVAGSMTMKPPPGRLGTI